MVQVKKKKPAIMLKVVNEKEHTAMLLSPAAEFSHQLAEEQTI